MDKNFSITLRNLREKRNISQNQLAELVNVDRSAIAHWESGDRVPSTKYLMKLAEVLGVDAAVFLDKTSEEKQAPIVIIVDDEAIALLGAKKVVSGVIPDAMVTTFNRCQDAVDFVKTHNVTLALLDIEIGQISGFDFSARIHELSPETDIIFLTSYPDYALKAWTTYAAGFLVKPLKRDDLSKALSTLRKFQ